MSVAKKRLYDLLPTYIRFRDQQLRDPELGVAPLEALVGALELPLHALEENIDALYRGWFIETCDQWRVPYIAQLLGVRGLDEAGAMIPGQRARVANTIAYRRRKGTPAALARAAEDATGWPCHVAEGRRITAATQTLGAPRPGRGGTVDLGDFRALVNLDTPFDRLPHTADLRHGRSGNPGTGIGPDSLALTFWRLESYPQSGGDAAPSSRQPHRCYRFHPAGVDTPLFNPPRTPEGTVYATEPRYVPLPLDRQELARELARRRRGEVSEEDFFGHPPAFRIRVRRAAGGDFRPIAPQAIEICDLSRWRSQRPRPTRDSAAVAVDPETGRIAFPEAEPGRQVRVDGCYGASADLGGGPYPRPDRLTEPAPAGWQAIVDRRSPPGIEAGVLRFSSLAEAVAAWRNAETESSAALIHIDDNARHEIGNLVLELEANRRLTIRGEERRWPQLVGDIEVWGAAGSRLDLDGLGIQGRVKLRERPSLTLSHCTVRPPGGEGIAVDYPPAPGGEHRIGVTVDHSIVLGSIRLPRSALGLEITDSIVDAGDGAAIQGTGAGDRSGGEPAEAGEAGPPAHVERSTLFGSVAVHQLWYAANTLFTGRVRVARPLEGQVVHCYFPAGSTTPPRQRCLEGPRTAGGRWLRPAFTSTTYGHPGYAQLGSCSGELCRGGEEGNEIGVFHHLRQSDRLANLEAILDEYLPAGFTPRVSFAT